MPRLLFEKTGNAVWISHLDLMRLFQRAFKRAGLRLTHTQGFNPRPSVSIALPLSVGVESNCELLDFDLEETVSPEVILEKLNAVLVDGIKVRSVYENGNKIKHLAYLDCSVIMKYDNGVSPAVRQKIAELFARPSLTVEKRSKNGTVQQDILPMIRRIEVIQQDEKTLELSALVCCQNPTLNPAQLAAAVEVYLPECRADFARCRRNEIYDTQENIFR